jgi:hypothetical protein
MSALHRGDSRGFRATCLVYRQTLADVFAAAAAARASLSRFGPRGGNEVRIDDPSIPVSRSDTAPRSWQSPPRRCKHGRRIQPGRWRDFSMSAPHRHNLHPFYQTGNFRQSLARSSADGNLLRQSISLRAFPRFPSGTPQRRPQQAFRVHNIVERRGRLSRLLRAHARCLSHRSP